MQLVVQNSRGLCIDCLSRFIFSPLRAKYVGLYYNKIPLIDSIDQRDNCLLLYFYKSSPASYAVVGIGTVVEGENRAVPSFAEQCTALTSDLIGCCDPA